jgi:hypothetical protein
MASCGEVSSSTFTTLPNVLPFDRDTIPTSAGPTRILLPLPTDSQLLNGSGPASRLDPWMRREYHRFGQKP